MIGTRSGGISEADVLDLVDRFLESGFFDLPPDFHCQVTDVDATTTTVFLHTRRNSIERCHTNLPGGPLEQVREICFGQHREADQDSHEARRALELRIG